MQKQRLYLLLLLGALVLNGWAQSGRQGNRFLAEQQFGRARNAFLTSLKDSPNDAAAWVGLGNACLALNAVDSAKTAFQKALSLDDKDPFALAGLGKVALVGNDRVGATTYFERARRAGKNNPELYCAIAEGCMNLARQDTATALNYLNQGLSLFPKNSCLHLSMGHLESIKGRYGPSANAFERAIFFDPTSAVAYRDLGRTQAVARSYRDALKAYNRSLELAPDQLLGYKYLGDLFYSLGRYPEAEKAYQTYLDRADATADDKERMAFTLFFNKKYHEAAALLEQVMVINHDESVLLRIRGYIAGETGDYLQGLEYMNRFFKLHDPNKLLWSDYSYYARMLQNTGKDSLAMLSFEKALTLDSAKTEFYADLARLAAKNRKHKEAAAYYQKLAAKGTDPLNSYFQMGKELYFEGDTWRARYDSLKSLQKTKKIVFTDSIAVDGNIKKYYTEADSAFTRVTQLSPDYAGGYIWKGRIGSLLDPEAQTTGARESYEKALALLEKGDADKNRKSIIECCKYLGSYYYFAYERLLKTDNQQAAAMKVQSTVYFTKIAEMDPNDAQAKEVLSKLKDRK